MLIGSRGAVTLQGRLDEHGIEETETIGCNCCVHILSEVVVVLYTVTFFVPGPHAVEQFPSTVSRVYPHLIFWHSSRVQAAVSVFVETGGHATPPPDAFTATWRVRVLIHESWKAEHADQTPKAPIWQSTIGVAHAGVVHLLRTRVSAQLRWKPEAVEFCSDRVNATSSMIPGRPPHVVPSADTHGGGCPIDELYGVVYIEME